MSPRFRALCGGFVLLASAVVGYLALLRKPCLTWGATEEEARMALPGDDLLADPDVVSTRAVTVDAHPSAIWPWLMQMGSGKGGMYTYDWIENAFGLNMHSVDTILPEFQSRKVGDVEQVGKYGPCLRIEILDTEEDMVICSEDGNRVWAFCLLPLSPARTRLVSRNRIAQPRASTLQRIVWTLLMEPGSLVMERKMLLGIKRRSGPERP